MKFRHKSIPLLHILLLWFFCVPSAHADWTFLISVAENEYEYVDMDSIRKDGPLTQIENMTVTPNGKSFMTWEINCESRQHHLTRIIIEDGATKTKGIVPMKTGGTEWKAARPNTLAGLVVGTACK